MTKRKDTSYLKQERITVYCKYRILLSPSVVLPCRNIQDIGSELLFFFYPWGLNSREHKQNYCCSLKKVFFWHNIIPSSCFKKKKKREKKCGCRTIQQLWEEDFLLYKFCWCLAHSQQWCIFSTLCVQSLMNAMLLKSLNVKNLKPRFSEQSRKVGEHIWEKEKEYEMTEQ